MTAWHEAQDIAAALGRDAPTRVPTVPLGCVGGVVTTLHEARDIAAALGRDADARPDRPSAAEEAS